MGRRLLGELAVTDDKHLAPTGHPYGHGYDVDELRTITDRGSDDEEDTPDPNYVCQSCQTEQYIDDHRHHTHNWCETCDTVRSFARLD
jgi:hypothetical protein